MNTTQRRAAHAKQALRHLVPTIDIATSNTTLLTPAEIATVIEPAQAAIEAFRTATSTRHQWLLLCTCLHVGRAIESGGVVKGLTDSLDEAHAALQTINDRMERAGNCWAPSALRAQELTAIRLLVRVHAYQLSQVSYGEYTRAHQLATARVASNGGELHTH